uniref:Tudor domain-containing protein n=1 Tax=Rodentolepis nana TaxID=102285 RepID=A0A0R3TUF0_RODNA
MSDKRSTVLYKDSNGEKYGFIEKTDNDRNRYLVVPFGSDSKLWVSKGDTKQLQKDINNDFVKLSLDWAINYLEEVEKNVTTTNVDDSSKSDEEIPQSGSVISDHVEAGISTCSNWLLLVPNWEIDQVCVCRWDYDNEWYFGVIWAIFPENRTVDVCFLYYENSQKFVPIDEIHPVNSTTIDWVKDDYNAAAASQILGVNWPVRQTTEEVIYEGSEPTSMASEEKKEVKPKKTKKRKGNSPLSEGRVNIPEISRIWLSLMEKECGSETSSLRRLILSQYQLGYNAGFKMGLKTRGGAVGEWRQ